MSAEHLVWPNPRAVGLVVAEHSLSPVSCSDSPLRSRPKGTDRPRPGSAITGPVRSRAPLD